VLELRPPPPTGRSTRGTQHDSNLGGRCLEELFSPLLLFSWFPPLLFFLLSGEDSPRPPCPIFLSDPAPLVPLLLDFFPWSVLPLGGMKEEFTYFTERLALLVKRRSDHCPVRAAGLCSPLFFYLCYMLLYRLESLGSHFD